MNLTVMQDGSEQIRYRDPSIPIYVSRGDLRTFPNMAALCHWHEDVELLISHKPYCKVETVDGWQIYDIVRQEFLTEEVFAEVIPYGKLSFLLKSEDGDKYLIMPLSYSGFNDCKVAVISSHLE